MWNFQENPAVMSEFEYQVRLGHKRQNTYKIQQFFEIWPLPNGMIHISPDVKFQENSDLVLEFEYQVRLGHKRQKPVKSQQFLTPLK